MIHRASPLLLSLFDPSYVAKWWGSATAFFHKFGNDI